MKMHSSKSWYFHRAGAAREVLALLIVCTAVILLSNAGFARIADWGPISTEASGDSLAPEEFPAVQTTSEAPASTRCAECGMFVSMREVESEGTVPGAAGGGTAGSRDEIRVKTARSYEITIRMADGSSRVISAANPANWRAGDRLIVIAGANPPRQ